MCPLNSKDLQRIFEKLDKNGDGLLSVEELNWLLERIGVSLSLKDVESSVGNSSLSFDEFLRFYYDSIDPQKQNNENEKEKDKKKEKTEYDGDRDLVDAFNVFDENGDGFISREELQRVLERLGLWDETSTGEDCRNMIGVFDTNLDGRLDFQEFKKMMMLQNVPNSTTQ